MGAVGLPLRPLASFPTACADVDDVAVQALSGGAAAAGCAAPPSPPTVDGSGGIASACGPVPLAVTMQFINACNGGDFNSARCAFSPAVAAALDVATLSSLYAGHACTQPTGYRVDQSGEMDVVIVRCADLQAGMLQWGVAVAPGQIAGIHFNAYGGAFEDIPPQCFPGGSLPPPCTGSGH